MNKRWSDYLFAFAVRAVAGFIIGGAVGWVVGWQLLLRRAARDDMLMVALWLVAWAVGGVVVAVLRIPDWQRPWSVSERGMEGNRGTGGSHDFKRVPPEHYHRRAHPSLKQYHDFVHWLRESTTAQLGAARGNGEATKAAIALFFHRGFKAGLESLELTELIPSIVGSLGYSDAEAAEVVTVLNRMDLDELRASCEPDRHDR